MIKLFFTSIAVVAALFFGWPTRASGGDEGARALLLLSTPPLQTIVLNGVPLGETELAALRQALTVPPDWPVVPGDYWYDRTSGLWGYPGGPSLGQIPPELNIGGPLAPDASGDSSEFFYDNATGLFGDVNGPFSQLPAGLELAGTDQPGPMPLNGTGVFLNGREIHFLELVILLDYFGNTTFPDPSTYVGRYWLKANGEYGLGDDPTMLMTGSFAAQGGQTGKYKETSPGSGIVNWSGGSVLGGGDTVGFISSEYNGISVTCAPDGGCIY